MVDDGRRRSDVGGPLHSESGLVLVVGLGNGGCLPTGLCVYLEGMYLHGRYDLRRTLTRGCLRSGLRIPWFSVSNPRQ